MTKVDMLQRYSKACLLERAILLQEVRSLIIACEGRQVTRSISPTTPQSNKDEEPKHARYQA